VYQTLWQYSDGTASCNLSSAVKRLHVIDCSGSNGYAQSAEIGR